MYTDCRVNVENFGDLLVGQKFVFFSGFPTNLSLCMKTSLSAYSRDRIEYYLTFLTSDDREIIEGWVLNGERS